jgi:hypothetical protein
MRSVLLMAALVVAGLLYWGAQRLSLKEAPRPAAASSTPSRPGTAAPVTGESQPRVTARGQQPGRSVAPDSEAPTVRYQWSTKPDSAGAIGDVKEWTQQQHFTQDQEQQLAQALAEVKANRDHAREAYLSELPDSEWATNGLRRDTIESEWTAITLGRDSRGELMERVREIAGDDAATAFDSRFGDLLPVLLGLDLTEPSR